MLVQPLFLLFVFVRILGDAGYVELSFIDVILPGLVALSGFAAALQSVALPLILEFGYTREIEDRLLAPIRTSLVAVEKLMVATVRGLAAAVLMFPLSLLVAGEVPFRLAGLPMLALVLLLGCWAGAAGGLVLGTTLPPSWVNVMFALILPPMLFTGATQYPWHSLGDLPWFQVVTALNPLTYVSEGTRGALAPAVPHLPPGLCLAVLAAADLLLTWAAVTRFTRRAVG